MKQRKVIRGLPIAVLVSLALSASQSFAVEGMWMPAQMPDIERQLEQAGIEISPDRLALASRWLL
jgi:hypothetical protein